MKKVKKTRKVTGKKPVPHLAELHPDAVAFGERIRKGWELDDAAQGYLVQAVENLSIATYAQETIKREGMIFTTQTGYKLPHPAWRIAKEASALYMRALHSMGIDMEASGPMGRPTGS
jgi:hypothetical protein